MSVEFVSGDLFASQCDALVNPVNCRGVMGKGLALEFKQRFPSILQPYQEDCRSRRLRPGKVRAYPVADGSGFEQPPFWVIAFPTKDDWKAPSRVEFIRFGLVDLGRVVGELGIRSVAMPALGCGLGGLPLESVEALVEQAFASERKFRVLFYRPI